ncbi:MAG: NAD(P)/FAD-dependent oxidoreductase [Candidatus Omnitrophota bacterium]
MVKADILVIGGGFAGLSTAYYLAKKGLKNIVVIEGEKKLGGHASGRNAGMIRQAIAEPVTARLAKKGRNELARADKKYWKDIGFQPNGSLLLSGAKGLEELRATHRTLAGMGVASRWISRNEAERKVPILKSAKFRRALFCPSDALVRIQALLRGFLKALSFYRVPVYCGLKVRTIERKEGGFLIRAGRRTFFAQKIVNAAGAAAGLVAEKAGAFSVPLTPYRRHLFQSGPFRAGAGKWPFVWDVSHNFYFRPVGDSLLLSPCDRVAVTKRYAAEGREKTDAHMKRILFRKMKASRADFRGLKIKEAKSGLRTMAPDGRFVLGEDPKLKNFYWVAGLGGHGVTTCFSVGKFAADSILGKKRDKSLVKALLPGRFRSINSRS